MYLGGIPADNVQDIYAYLWRKSNASSAIANLRALYGENGYVDVYMLVLTTALSCQCKNIDFMTYMTDTHFMISSMEGVMAVGPRDKHDEWYQIQPVYVKFLRFLAYLPLALDIHPAKWASRIDKPATSLDIWTAARLAHIYTPTQEDWLLQVVTAINASAGCCTILYPLIWLASLPYLRSIAEELMVRKLMAAVLLKHTSSHLDLRVDGLTTEAMIATFRDNVPIMTLLRQLEPPEGHANQIPDPASDTRVTRAAVRSLRTQAQIFVHTNEDNSHIQVDGLEYMDLYTYIVSGAYYFLVNPACGSLNRNEYEDHEPGCGNRTPPEQLERYAQLLSQYLLSCDGISITAIYVDRDTNDPTCSPWQHIDDPDDKKITVIALHDGTAWFARMFNHVDRTMTAMGIENRRCARYDAQLVQLRTAQESLGLTDLQGWRPYQKLNLTDKQYMGIFQRVPHTDCSNPVNCLADEHDNRHHDQAISGARIAIWTAWFARGWRLRHRVRDDTTREPFEAKVRELSIYWSALHSRSPLTHDFWKLPWVGAPAN